METAAWLLRETDLKIFEIGDLVFDTYLSKFSKRFTRWAGMSPKKYRAAARAAAVEAESQVHELGEIARAILRDGGTELDVGQIDRMMRHRRRTGPSPCDDRSPPGVLTRWRRSGRASPQLDQGARRRQAGNG